MRLAELKMMKESILKPDQYWPRYG